MTISNLAGFSVRAEIPSEDKVARADGFASQVDIFNVSLVFAGWNEAYVQELRYFPNGSWKDQVDASSGAFRQLSHSTIAWGAI
jgi:predicted phage terminase large subunit-like protein